MTGAEDRSGQPPEGEAGAAAPEDLAEKLARAEAAVKENWDLFLRARADLENYRRRVERDLEAMVRRGKRDLVMRLLDVVDALERATEWEATQGAPSRPAAPSAAGGTTPGRPPAARGTTAAAEDGTGFARIHRQLLKVLADEGVTPLDSVGQPFDPALHEAVDVVPDPSVASETVAAEYQKGYTYEGEVLRPARVRVAQPPPA